MRGARLVIMIAGVVIASVAVGGCDVCGLIDQHVVVAVDDPELGPLIDDCRNGRAPPSEPLCADPVNAIIEAGCACLPLCQRVYAIVDANPHRPALEGCNLSLDTQGRARIEIQYRSVCH